MTAIRLTATLFAAAVAAPAFANGEDLCGAAGFQGLIGQSREIAEMLDLDGPSRIYALGDPITLDHRVDRINFVIGEDGSIVEISCG